MRIRTSEPEARRLPARQARKIRLAIIRADYNPEITRSLETKCVETLAAAGIDSRHIRTFAVPGCFEIPIMAERLAARKRYHAMIALGAVIRGDTYHFELVVNGCAQGIMQVSLKHDVPIIFEVLATYNRRDALRRAGNNQLNKGVEAARAALSLLAALDKLKG